MKRLVALLLFAVGASAQTPLFSVSVASPAAQPFTFTFAGAPYDQIMMRFGTSDVRSCLLLYQGGAFDWLYLLNDDGTIPWNASNPVHLGITGRLSNSQCSVALPISLTTANGVTTVSATITFTPSFAGSHPIAMCTYRYPNSPSPWVNLGSWNVTGIARPLRIREYESTLGITDGINTIFVLVNVPDVAPDVYLNGLKQRVGADYTLSGQTLTFAAPPPLGAYVEVDYSK